MRQPDGKRSLGLNTQVASMSSSEVFPARTSPTPASALVWEGCAPGSGLSSTDVLASFDPASSSWKTSAGSLFEDSTPFSDAWPDEGMTRNGRLYARRMLARRTAERACSSSPTELDHWPTPQKVERDDPKKEYTRPANAYYPDGRKCQPTLSGAVNRYWPTPIATDSTSSARHTTTTGVMHPGTTLTDAVRADDWMTPQSRDYKGISQKVAKGEYTGGLPDQLAGLHDRVNHNTDGNPRAPSPRPVLNPRWVACLMGFPADYLDGVEPPSRRSGTR